MEGGGGIAASAISVVSTTFDSSSTFSMLLASAACASLPPLNLEPTSSSKSTKEAHGCTVIMSSETGLFMMPHGPATEVRFIWPKNIMKDKKLEDNMRLNREKPQRWRASDVAYDRTL